MAKNKRKQNTVNNSINNTSVNNSLTGAMDLPTNNPMYNPLTDPKAIYYNANPYCLTLNPRPLSYAYKSIGFIQTAINQIVDDAFRNDGLIIESKTLEPDEVALLKQVMEDEGDIEAIKDCIRWGQLYGGGVLIANTEQNPELPIIEKQLKGKKLEFLATDRWYCPCMGVTPQNSDYFILNKQQGLELNSKVDSITIDKSRIGLFTGVVAPYDIRSLLGGWGMSIFEAIIPPLNQYLKSMGVALELLDEAKIDVIKVFDLANTLLSPGGENKVRKRMQIVAEGKNYKDIVVMDSQDDYQQKQINFGGLPEMIVQIQYLVCSALKRPYSKIFGKGSSGFSSGDDDLENYNTIVDAEIRTPARRLIKWVVDLRCQQLFGRALPDFSPKWKPLRVMSEKDEADIKSKKLADLLQLLDRQVITKQQLAKHLTEDNIVLFSDKEISKLSDEFEQEYENMEELTK